MILIGELSLWVALLMAAWSTTVSYAGGALRRDDLTDSGVRGLYATFVMVALAAIGLWTALLSRDLSLEYVAGHISQNMPSLYVFTAFWSGQEGSLLLWALILSMLGAVAVATSRRRNPELVPWATGTLSAILLFFVATACIKTNPFVRLDFTPLDGRGMRPHLQNPGMVLNPPSLYLGYAATALPFSFAIAALLARCLDAEWLGVARRWTLLSWFFLTLGIVIGMWWAYVEPGLGGQWALNAVENSSLLPWLTVTATLHAIIAQRTRRILRKWNVVLVAMSFPLAIFAAFIARGGAIGSETTQSSAGTWFSVFFLLTTGMTVYLVGVRLRDLEPKVTSDSLIRNRRGYGGYIVHAGIVMLLAAFAGLAFRREYDAALKTGEAYQASDPYGHVWRFVSQGPSNFDRPDRTAIGVVLDTYRDGKRVGLISSEQRTYRDVQGNTLFQPSTQVGIHSTPTLDTYVAFAGWRRAQDGSGRADVAVLHIAFNPFVACVWAGGFVIMIGGLLVMWLQAEPRFEMAMRSHGDR